MYTRVKKRKATKRNPKLDAEWEALLKRHANPLQKGAKANGVKVARLLQPVVAPVEQPKERKKLPIPNNQNAGTKPIVDPLASAKDQLKARVGQSFNKGGLSYLTDDELEEHKQGLHRRR
jgi:hypothetical protein